MDITLTPLQHDDIDLVRTWRNSPDVSQYMYTEAEITAEQQENWYQKIKDDPSSSQTFSSCYWAFYLGDTAIRGGGIGSKIEYNVLEYVFQELKLNKLRCEVFVFNDKVISLHEKFGFRREAYYRQHVRKQGRWQDVVGLAMLRDEWAIYREAMRKKIYGD